MNYNILNMLKLCLRMGLICLISMKSALAGTVLVTNVLSNSVSLFDDKTLQRIKEIKVGFMPHEVVVAPNDKIALVSNFGDLLNLKPGNSLTVIDIANSKSLQTIQLPDKSRPHGIAFISDTQALITAQGIQSLLVIDISTNSIIKTIPLPGAGAHMVVVDTEKRFAYVANIDSGTLCKIDIKNFSVIGHMKIGNDAEGLALTVEEDLILVTDRKDNYVAVIRTKDLALQKKIPTRYGPTRVVMFNHGQSAAVANTIGGNVQVINMASLTIDNMFSTTQSQSSLSIPVNIAVTEDQKTAYITHFFANKVTLVDLIKGEVLKEIEDNAMPDGVAVSKAIAE